MACDDAPREAGRMHHQERTILRLLGRNLAAERRRHDLTQEQVAGRMGVATTHVARMEQGRHDSGITSYLKAAWAIGMAPAELFRELDEPLDADGAGGTTQI